jgi:antitoxin MazE
MKAKLVPIGNSKGIRIPKTVLDQCHFSTEVELEVRGNSLVLKPSKATREGWAKAFEQMHANGDDQLLDTDASMSSWDNKQWEW